MIAYTLSIYSNILDESSDKKVCRLDFDNFLALADALQEADFMNFISTKYNAVRSGVAAVKEAFADFGVQCIFESSAVIKDTPNRGIVYSLKGTIVPDKEALEKAKQDLIEKKIYLKIKGI